MVPDTDDPLLRALKALAHDLHKPAPTEVIREPGLITHDQVLEHNLRMLIDGTVLVGDTTIYVPPGVATHVLAHFGAKGTNISSVNRNGCREVTKADWLNHIA